MTVTPSELAPVLANTYRLLIEDGRPVTRDGIRRDIGKLFRSNFENFAGSAARLAHSEEPA